MVRPVFMNPDQQTGFGSPWELQWIALLRSKGGNVEGFSSDFAMVPESKLGVVVLINTDASEFKFAFRALEILIPALEEYSAECQRTHFHPPAPPNIHDHVGVYGDLFHVDVDPQQQETGLPTQLRIKTIEWEVWGWLIWTPTDDDRDTFVFYNQFPNNLDNLCWDITLGAFDGNIVRFERDAHGRQAVNRMVVDGLLYGVPL